MIPRRIVPQRLYHKYAGIPSFVQTLHPTIHCHPSAKMTQQGLHPQQAAARRRKSLSSSSSSSATTAKTTPPPPPPTIKDDNRIIIIPPIIETNPSLLTAIIDPINRLHGTMQHFKNGLNRLIKDYYLVRYIHDASRTRRLLLQQQQQRNNKNNIPPPNNIINNNNNNNKRAYPDRRAQEHLRQFSRDISITLPTVAAFILLPVVGNVALFLGMAFPRYLLSRQFHTHEQRRNFAMEEYGSRRVCFVSLLTNTESDTDADNSLSSLLLLRTYYQRNVKDHDQRQQQQQQPTIIMDVAGPIYDISSMHSLYKYIHDTKLSIHTLSRNQLVKLALANNLSSFSSSIALSLFVQSCLPSIYIARKLITLAEDIVMDDIAMIDEGYHHCIYYYNHDNDDDSGGGNYYYCVGMTDIEVFEACYIRGLPVGRFATAYDGIKGNNSKEGEAVATRKLLAHYLQMMDMVMNQKSDNDILLCSSHSSSSSSRKGELVRNGTLQLLVLHIHAIRYNFLIQNRKEGMN